jgi:Mn2+/Fe2+ NRAMP family transporter
VLVAILGTTIAPHLPNLIMYFIVLTTAATLHAHGQTDFTTARQAAEALRPLAGNGAYRSGLAIGASTEAIPLTEWAARAA